MHDQLGVRKKYTSKYNFNSINENKLVLTKKINTYKPCKLKTFSTFVYFYSSLSGIINT